MFKFSDRSPERDYVMVFSDGDHYYIKYEQHIKYLALYEQHNADGVWCYPESVPANKRIYGRP
jgi:hypothetical protein